MRLVWYEMPMKVQNICEGFTVCSRPSRKKKEVIYIMGVKVNQYQAKIEKKLSKSTKSD